MDPGFEAGRVLASVVLPLPLVILIPNSARSSTGGFWERFARFLVWRVPERSTLYRSAAKTIAGSSAPAAPRHLWPEAGALGQRICVYCTPEDPDNWKQVVGVVSSASHAALDEPEKGNVYLAAGAMEKSVFLVVRTGRSAGEIGKAIRAAIASLDPNQPVLLSASMRDLIAASVADRRFIMILLSITGFLALVMSTAGIYGVVSYTTSRRTQEIGIRMALGATPAAVVSLIFRQGFQTVTAGLVMRCCWVPLKAAPAESGVRAGVRSCGHHLDRSGSGGGHSRHRLLDSRAPGGCDEPDVRAS